MINEIALGKAFAIAAAMFWIVCSLLVWLSPAIMMDMTGYMMHVNLETATWHLPLTGVIAGLVLWTLLSGLFGWVVGIFYNRFIPTTD